MAIARQRIHLPPGGWPLAFSNWVRGAVWEGDAIERFEGAFAEFIGVPGAVAVPSGRAGLSFIYDAIGLEPGAEVICSAFGYPVVPHLTRSLGYDLKLADCELNTLGMDPAALSKVISDRTRVVLVTHLYGVPCRIREIVEIAESHGAIVIEDCAHCFGASVDGRKVGSFGSFAYFSFETSKPINTMGGGMVTTDDPETAQRIRNASREQESKDLGWLSKRLLKTTFEATVTHPAIFNLGVYPALRVIERREKTAERFASGYQRDEVTMLGRMGRYTNYQAQLGLQQIDRVRAAMDRRVAHAKRLHERLGKRVRFQVSDDPAVVSNYMLVTALFSKMDEVARELLRLGVDTKHHYMRDCSGLLVSRREFPRAATAEREVLHLPAYPELTDAQIDRMADKISRVVATVGEKSPRPENSEQSSDRRVS